MSCTTYFHQQGQRSYQEDAFYIDSEHRFYVVCDGVGGTTHGKLASRTVADSVRRQVDCCGVPLNRQEAENLLKDVWDDFIYTYRCHLEAKGMGTTRVAAFVMKDELLIAHVGDSRAYHIRPGKGLLWRTKDHSEVQELYDAGIISSVKAMEDHPLRNVITRAFIARNDAVMPKVDYHTIPDFRRGDILMMCTDGVLEPFSRDSHVDIVADPGHSRRRSFGHAVWRCLRIIIQRCLWSIETTKFNQEKAFWS